MNKLRLAYSVAAFRSKGTTFSLANQSFYSTTAITISKQDAVDYLIKSCGLSPEGAVIALKRITFQSTERADSVLAILKNRGFSKNQIWKVVRSNTRIIKQDPHKNLLPKLDYFASLGASTADIATIVASNPSLLWQSLDNTIIPNCSTLRRLLFLSAEDVVGILKRCSWFVSINFTITVVPNLKLLRESGMPESSITLLTLLTHNSWLLRSNAKELVQVVHQAMQMGYACFGLLGKLSLQFYQENEDFLASCNKIDSSAIE